MDLVVACLAKIFKVDWAASNIDITFQTAIIKNNPKKAVRSVGDGEVLKVAISQYSQSSIWTDKMT